jgi:hypothetical protein
MFGAVWRNKPAHSVFSTISYHMAQKQLTNDETQSITGSRSGETLKPPRVTPTGRSFKNTSSAEEQFLGIEPISKKFHSTSQINGNNGEWTNGDDMPAKARKPTGKKTKEAKKESKARRGDKLVMQKMILDTVMKDKNALGQAVKKQLGGTAIKGRGDYSGGAIGANLGSKIGSWIGKKAEAFLGKIFGSGDYEMQAPGGAGINQNSLVAGSGIPAMHTDNSGASQFMFHEFLGNINMTVAFNLNTFNIDVTDPRTFPWLNNIAKNYQQWQLRGCIFIIRSLTGDAVIAPTQGMGSIFGSIRYDVNSAAPTTKKEMLNSMFSSSAKPSVNQAFPVECDRKQSPVSIMKTLMPGVVPTDLQLYRVGYLDIATEGGANNFSDCAEVHILYDCAFYKPRTEIGGGGPMYSLDLVGNVSTALLKPWPDTLNVRQPRVNTLGLSLWPDQKSVAFPLSTPIGSCYLVMFCILGSSGTNIYVPYIDITAGLVYKAALVDQSRSGFTDPVSAANTGSCNITAVATLKYVGTGATQAAPARVIVDILGGSNFPTGNFGGTFFVIELAPEAITGLTSTPPTAPYLRTEFFKYLCDMVAGRRSTFQPPVGLGRICDWTHQFTKTDSWKRDDVLPTSSAAFELTFMEALSIMTKYVDPTDFSDHTTARFHDAEHKVETAVYHVNSPGEHFTAGLGATVVSDDYGDAMHNLGPDEFEDFLAFKKARSAGKGKKKCVASSDSESDIVDVKPVKPKVRSQLNGNNGSVTNTDDVSIHTDGASESYFYAVSQPELRLKAHKEMQHSVLFTWPLEIINGDQALAYCRAVIAQSFSRFPGVISQIVRSYTDPLCGYCIESFDTHRVVGRRVRSTCGCGGALACTKGYCDANDFGLSGCVCDALRGLKDYLKGLMEYDDLRCVSALLKAVKLRATPTPGRLRLIKAVEGKMQSAEAALRLRSQINGANGEYTGSDDVGFEWGQGLSAVECFQGLSCDVKDSHAHKRQGDKKKLKGAAKRISDANNAKRTPEEKTNMLMKSLAPCFYTYDDVDESIRCPTPEHWHCYVQEDGSLVPCPMAISASKQQYTRFEGTPEEKKMQDFILVKTKECVDEAKAKAEAKRKEIEKELSKPPPERKRFEVAIEKRREKFEEEKKKKPKVIVKAKFDDIEAMGFTASVSASSTDKIVGRTVGDEAEEKVIDSKVEEKSESKSAAASYDVPVSNNGDATVLGLELEYFDDEPKTYDSPLIVPEKYSLGYYDGVLSNKLLYDNFGLDVLEQTFRNACSCRKCFRSYPYGLRPEHGVRYCREDMCTNTAPCLDHLTLDQMAINGRRADLHYLCHANSDYCSGFFHSTYMSKPSPVQTGRLQIMRGQKLHYHVVNPCPIAWDKVCNCPGDTAYAESQNRSMTLRQINSPSVGPARSRGRQRGRKGIVIDKIRDICKKTDDKITSIVYEAPAPPVEDLLPLGQERVKVYYTVDFRKADGPIDQLKNWVRDHTPFSYSGVGYNINEDTPLSSSETMSVSSNEFKTRTWSLPWDPHWLKTPSSVDKTYKDWVYLTAANYRSVATVPIFTKLYQEFFNIKEDHIRQLHVHEVVRLMKEEKGKVEVVDSFVSAARNCMLKLPSACELFNTDVRVFENTLHFFIQQKMLSGMKGSTTIVKKLNAAFR